MNKLMMVLACSMCLFPVWATSAFQSNAFQELPDPPKFPLPGISQPNTSNVIRSLAANKRRQADPLAHAIELLKTADDSDSEDEAKDSIRQALENQYEEFLVANEQQIKDLQTRLDELQDQLDRRRRAKKKLVELEFERLINESEGLIWPANKRAKNATVGVPYSDRNGESRVFQRSQADRFPPAGVRRTRKSEDPFGNRRKGSASAK